MSKPIKGMPPEMEVAFEADDKVYHCLDCERRVGDATGLMIHLMDHHGMDYKSATEYRISLNNRGEVLEVEEKIQQKRQYLEERSKIKWAK